MKHKRIVVPIYNSWVYVVSDVQECIRIAPLKTGVWLSESDFDAKGMTIYGSGRNIIWLPEGASINTIAHEVTHALLNICHVKGISIDLDNQEPTTYLMGWLMGEVVKAHNKLKEANNG